MSFLIKEKLIDLNDSLIKSIDFFVLLPSNKLLVLGSDNKKDKHNKFKLLFEVWDLNNNFVLTEGKIDLFAISYLCKFIHYKNDKLFNVKSANGQRFLIIFDCIANSQKILSEINRENLNNNGKSLKTELFYFSESSKIVFSEILLVKERQTYNKNEIDEYYFIVFYLFDIINENEAKNVCSLKMRREIDEKNKFFPFKIIKGNEEKFIIIFDYNLNEILFWNFMEINNEIKYFYMNFQDFKILKSIQTQNFISFVLKNKNFKYMKILNIDINGNRCIMNDLFNVEKNDKIIDFSKISENKVFFLHKYNKVFLFIMIKFQNSFNKTHYFLYENNENNSMLSEVNFKLRMNYEKKQIMNYFFKQKECFQSIVCLCKQINDKNSNASKSNGSFKSSVENENPLTMRVFSFLTQNYDNLYVNLKILFFYLMKKEKNYDLTTIILIYKLIFGD